jgi:type III restriction enzyme
MAKPPKQTYDLTDAMAASQADPAYRFVYVDQAGFETHKPKEFAAMPAAFTDYQRD